MFVDRLQWGVMLTFSFVFVISNSLEAREPSWTGAVVKVGEDRVETQAKPIEARPYRPLHVYGNTVRRMKYRGEVLPRPRDFAQGFSAFVGR